MEVSVLIVEDESIVALDLKFRLSALGYRVAGIAGTSAEALAIVAAERPDIVLMDIQIRGPVDGIETAGRIYEEFEIPSIFITAYSDPESLERAKAVSPFGYLLKPFQERELEIAIELAIHKNESDCALRRTREVLDVTLRSITEGVITADRSGVILFANEAAATMLGCEPSDVVGERLAEVVQITPQEAPAETGESWGELRVSEGAPRPVQYSTHYTSSHTNSDVHEVLVFRDISKAQEYQHGLVAAKEAAEAAVAARSHFMARVTHELRTPLNSILGLSNVARDRLADHPIANELAIIESSASMLLGIVNEILEYSTTNTGAEPVRSTAVDLHEFLFGCLSMIVGDARTKGLRTVLIVDPTLPPVAHCDEGRVRQILTRVLSNALKFTETGYVALIARPLLEQHQLQITVEDSGVGVPQESREEIFDAFTQLESPATRRSGGLGLGLAHARQLAAELSGTLLLEDGPSGGSAVTLTIPVEWPLSTQSESLSQSPHQPQPQQPVSRYQHVVCSDELLRRTFEPWCRLAGASVSSARDTAPEGDAGEAARDGARDLAPESDTAAVRELVVTTDVAPRDGGAAATVVSAGDGMHRDTVQIATGTAARTTGTAPEAAPYAEPLRVGAILRILSEGVSLTTSAPAPPVEPQVTMHTQIAMLRSECDRDTDAFHDIVSDLSSHDLPAEASEIVFRLRLAARRGDRTTIEQLITELEEVFAYG